MNEAGKQPSPPAHADEAELERLREAIDRTDRALLAALNERARLVAAVGELKRSSGAGVYDAARERDLIAALVAANPGPFPNRALPHVFREIVSGTRALESELRVAFLGPEGTFSHLAARRAFGSVARFLPCASLAEVFAAVERGAADHGVVPVENTTEGIVTASFDAFAESSLPICGELLLRVSHDLLARGGELGAIRRVASHPQPLAQCRGWLDRQLPGIERLETASTVAAARLAAEDEATAAVASPLAGERFGLRALATGIEDRHDNTTRFLVLGGDEAPPSGNDLSSVVFTVRKAQPGALHRLLEPFARHGVNLTSIQSRPLRGTPFEYLFFFDLEGHRSEARVARALTEAAEFASSCRVLGSFPRAAVLSRPGAEG